MSRDESLADDPCGAAVIARTEAFVKADMAGNDGSHDWFHVDRVRRMAMTLAREEGVVDAQRLLVVELAALLHDVKDHKYHDGDGDEDGPAAVRSFLLEAFGEDSDEARPGGVVDRVEHVVRHVGFKSELGGLPDDALTIELACVQDADRLDAIGAVGIARTFTFGGRRNRAIHDPATVRPELEQQQLTQAEYVAASSGATDSAPPTTQHFYDKLLKLKDMMKTKSGARRSKDRHDFMQLFLSHLYDEWDCTQ